MQNMNHLLALTEHVNQLINAIVTKLQHGGRLFYMLQEHGSVKKAMES